MPSCHRLFDAAERRDWPGLFRALDGWKGNTLNLVRPDDPSWYTILHHVAVGDAPPEVVQQLLALGHFRSTRCAEGKRPVDLARPRLLPLLEPVVKHSIPRGMLADLQHHFHQLILETAKSSFLNPYELRLPPLELLLDLGVPMLNFRAPFIATMYVCRLQQVACPIGFAEAQEEWFLLVRRYCSMGEGEEWRYLVTSTGCHLLHHEIYD